MAYLFNGTEKTREELKELWNNEIKGKEDKYESFDALENTAKNMFDYGCYEYEMIPANSHNRFTFEKEDELC